MPAGRSATSGFALAAIALGFVAFGAYWGAWAATAADTKRTFELDAGGFGLLLACFVVAGVPAGLVAGRLCDRHGARAVALAGGALLGVGGIALAATPSLQFAVACAMTAGAGSAVFDIGINTEAVAFQERVGGRVLGRMHALYFLGSAGGGVIAAVVVAAGGSHRLVQGFAASLSLVAIVAIALAGSLAHLPTTAAERPDARTALRHPVVRRMALVLLLAFLVEGALEAWTGIYLRESLQLSAAAGSIGVAILFASMTVGALASDAIARRLDARRLMLLAGLGVTVAMVAAVATREPVAAVACFATVAFLFGTLPPTVYSEAADALTEAAGAAVAALTVVSYLAFLVGPVMIGALADAIGLRTSLGSLSALGLVCAALALQHRPVRVAPVR